MAITPSPSLLKAMVFPCSRFSNHTISSIAHQNHNIHIDMNITFTQLCRKGRLKDAIHILLTSNANAHNSLHSSTCLQLLQTCIANNALSEGKLLHSLINRIGHKFDPSKHKFLQDRLIHMYANCGSLSDASKVFDCMTERDVFSWNMIISAYQRHGFPRRALTLFHQMQQTAEAVQPDQFTFPSVLNACAKLGDSEQGLYIHQRLFKSGFLSDDVVVNALVDMYAKCGSVEKARELFDKMPHQNAFSWTAVIAGYAQNGFSEKALETFKQMQLSGVKPDSVTFASILPACANMGALEEGINVHQKVIESKFSADVVVVNALIDMYGKCGRIDKAQELFDKMHNADTVSWTAMVAGYAQNGYVEKARELFDKMPNGNAVSWNAMISGYAQNGHVEKARKLFDKMPQRSIVSWNAMIAGYAQNGFSEKALETFKQMQLSSAKPDSVTFASVLPACASMGALEEGMDIHKKVTESKFSTDVVVLSALIDMYAKCGRIDKARELFDNMHDANIVSWNAMIAGYAFHGYGEDALKLFELMKHLGPTPDNITFVCVLLACNHAGLVDEGCKCFNSMSDFYCIIPGMNHYVCIVDLLGRAGYLEEALNFIAKMPIKPELVVWMCLLGACRLHKNIGIGEFVATILFVLEPTFAPSYILLSNIYAEVGSWDDVQRIRTLMRDRGIRKTPGCSWIEVHKRVHAFCVGETTPTNTGDLWKIGGIVE